MTVTLIAALDEDGAIGVSSGGLPWHLPDEAARFRAFCRGKWMLVGRRTFDEMRGWFTDQTPLVLTARRERDAVDRVDSVDDAGGAPDGLIVPRFVASVAAAIDLARRGGACELVVAGGAATYAAALPFATRIILSRIAGHHGGGVRFPPVEWSQWRFARRDPTRIDASSGIAFSIEQWERVPDQGDGTSGDGPPAPDHPRAE